MSTVPPLRREIIVDTDPATAFEVFTAQIGRWWPIAEKGVFGADATVAFDDGQIVERGTHEQLLEHGGRYAALLSGAAVAEGPPVENGSNGVVPPVGPSSAALA